MQPLLKFLSYIPDLILPRSCPICGASRPPGAAGSVCRLCIQSLERTPSPKCPTCGKPFHSKTTLLHSPNHICAECLEHPPAYDSARAIGPYNGSLRELIQLFKFRGRPAIAAELGKELAQLASQEYAGLVSEEDTLVTFVPIDQKRWRERGFDQAKILAQSTAEHLKLKFTPTIERKKSASPQTALSASQRRGNLRGVFFISKPESVSGKNVLLVDDVLTTGSTVSSCSRVLKRAGAKSVCILTICHTVVQILPFLKSDTQHHPPHN